MSWYWWVLLGALVVIVARFGLKVLVGAAAPKAVSGAFYLRDQLRQRGIDINKVPAPCLEEISAWSEQVASAWSPNGFHTRFIELLDTQVDAIENYLYGDPPPAGEGRETRCEELLAEHGVTKGAIKT